MARSLLADGLEDKQSKFVFKKFFIYALVISKGITVYNTDSAQIK
jgi:hypothetical protein